MATLLYSGRSYFVFKDISENENKNYIKNMKVNNSVHSGIPSINFVKLNAKTIALYL